MMNLLAILLSALVLQDTKTIVRQEKAEYNAAVAKIKEAEGLVDSDPQAAVDRLTELIGNTKLRVSECVLKIEQRPGDYSEHLFLPYQNRGKARMNLAKKATGDAAQRLVAAALDDFHESVKRNVASSAELAKGAEAALAKLKSDVTKPPDPLVKVDPVAKFREKWDPLFRNERFKAAKTLLEKDSEGLTEDQKKGFLHTAEQGCRDLLTNWVSDFRPRFINAMGLGLDQKTSEEFELLFSLPPTDELIVSNPAVDWVRQHLTAFRNVQSRKSPASSLAAAAVASAPLEERFQNPWFKAVASAVFQSLRDEVSAEVGGVKDLAKADREKARQKATALLDQWKGFKAKLDPKFAERHGFLADQDRQLAGLLDVFPTDLAELDKLEKDVDAAFGADSPDAELGKIEDALTSLESKSTTRESRQRLYTIRVTVGALRGLFHGKTEDAVAGELSSYRQRLRELGGPGDVKKYGPRVEKVFAALR